MKKIFIIIVLLAALGAGGFFFLNRNGDALAVAHLQRGPVVQAVYASGTVEPSVMIPIAPRQSARLMQLLADEGQEVKKGQGLGQLEDEDLSHALEELRSKADLAQRDFKRKAALLKTKAISQEAYDEAKSAAAAADAAAGRAEAELSYLKLVAPEDGVVIRRDGEVGELLAPGRPVFWMSCCQPLRIAAEVDEEDITLVKPGEKVLITADAFPGKIFNGEVKSVTPKGDAVARSYRVRVGLEEGTPLMIGMTAETNIIIRESKDALLAPTGSVKDGKIWVVENGAARAVPVVTGAMGDKGVEIISGLDENATVVMDAGKVKEGGVKLSTVVKPWKAQ